MSDERVENLESRVEAWVRSRIGDEYMHPRERTMRMFEEQVELAQAEGITAEMLTRQIAHVFGRPAGEPEQEAGGVAVCLAAWCAARGTTIQSVLLTELERIEAQPLDQIRGSLARKADADLVVAVDPDAATAVERFIDAHGLTCDCCQHVMIDVTAARSGEKQHCIAGDLEGEGSGCAHGMLADSNATRERLEAARCELNTIYDGSSPLAHEAPLELAIQKAAHWHRGQRDKAGQLYILHPLSVMFRVRRAGHDGATQVAAVLHDVVEDCGVELNEIDHYFGAVIVDVVDALTRRSGEKYEQFIERARANTRARCVKLADIYDNLDPNRHAWVNADPKKMAQLRKRYERARARLL